jgi:hypothetical protein
LQILADAPLMTTASKGHKDVAFPSTLTRKSPRTKMKVSAIQAAVVAWVSVPSLLLAILPVGDSPGRWGSG